MKRLFTARKGTALMVVVIFSVVITAFSFTLLDTSLLDFRKINQMEEDIAIKALADGALERMILQLLENTPRLDPVSTPKLSEGQGFATAENIAPNQFKVLSWAEPAHPSSLSTQRRWEWILQIQNGRVKAMNRKMLTIHTTPQKK